VSARHIQITRDAADLAWTAASEFIRIGREAIAERGTFHVALSGGGTPIPMYALLALPEWRTRLAWDKVHIYWGDERCVPPDASSSNYGTAKNALLERLDLPAANIHRIHGELPPEEGAEHYVRVVGGVIFDLILLGMGDDGHTASLFPGSPLLFEAARLVAPVYVEHLNSWRVTLTPPAINAGKVVMFLVSGVGKAERLYEVLYGEDAPERLPAQLIKAGRVIWLVDQEAAGKLPIESPP